MKIFQFVAAALVVTSVSTACALPRDAVQKHAFRRANPCPVTGERKGACPGHEIDHRKALMNGGADTPRNMQWLPREEHRVKTQRDHAACRGSYFCKNQRLKKKLPWQRQTARGHFSIIQNYGSDKP